MRLTTIFVVFFVLLITDVRGLSIAKEKRLLDELDELDDDLSKLSDALKDLSNDDTKNNQAKEPIDIIIDINEHLTSEPNVTILYGDEAQPEPMRHGGNEKRNAIRGTDHLWNRDIPYVIDSSLINHNPAITAIQDAIDEISSQSCITFKPRTGGETPYLNFFNGSGCWSYVGNYYSKQYISIGKGCESKGIAIHEILHALGFYHEQSRYDRNEYVTIYWENIRPGREGNFKRLTRSNSRNLDTPYDYESIMHYSKYSFSKSDKPTIEASPDKSISLGQRERLSKEDINSLNRLYHCTDGAADKWTSWTAFGDCHAFSATDCSQKRYRYCPVGTCVCSSSSSSCTVESKNCAVEDCKLDGHWGKWTLWTDCSGGPMCSKGTKTRSRNCDGPAPLFGGQTCPGDKQVTLDCTVACPKACTFEEDFCDYTIDDTDIWQRTHGSTPSSYTGPSSDAAGSFDGFYAYTEVSGNWSPPDIRATLKSPTFDGSSSTQCYSFQYHMHGWSIGKLEIFLSDSTGDILKFIKTGDQEDKWHDGFFEINKNNEFWITIIGTRGYNWGGDIAVDNLFLKDGPCGGITTTKTPTTSTATASTTTTTTKPTTSTTTTKTTTTTPPTTSTTTTTPSTTSSTTTTTTTTTTPPTTSTTTTTPPTTSSTTTTTTTTTTLPATPSTTSTESTTETISTKPTTETTATQKGSTTTTIAPYVPVTQLHKFECSMDDGSRCGMTQQRPFWADAASDFLQWDVNDAIVQRTGKIGYALSLYATSAEHVARRSSIKTQEFQDNRREWIEFYYRMSKEAVDGSESDEIGLIEGVDGSESDQIGLIEVSAVNENTGESCVIFSTTYGRNGVWEHGLGQIKVSRRDKFSLVFTGVLASEESVIAIDDIRGMYIPTAVVINHPNVRSESDLDCTFNSGDTCSWENVGESEWEPSTTDSSSGDNALAAFVKDELFLTAASQGEKKTVILKSGVVHTKVRACMILPAIVLGDGNSLRVNQTIFRGKRVVRNTKDFSKPTGNWKNIEIPLPRSNSFEVYIVAIVNPSADGTASSVSIDDIEVRKGFCPKVLAAKNKKKSNAKKRKAKAKGKSDEESWGDDLFLLDEPL